MRSPVHPVPALFVKAYALAFFQERFGSNPQIFSFKRNIMIDKTESAIF
jgi:hypothetical protein